jgi:hypothetical protein
MDDAELKLAGRLATQLRVYSIRCSTEAASERRRPRFTCPPLP